MNYLWTLCCCTRHALRRFMAKNYFSATIVSQRRIEHKTARWYSNGSSYKRAIITVLWIGGMTRSQLFRKMFRSIYSSHMNEPSEFFSTREDSRLEVSSARGWKEFDQKSLSCLPQRARVITVQAMWIIGKRRTHVCCTPSPRARVCVFLLYSLTNVPYRCLAVYCISNAANALRYTEFPFRVNPTGERNPCIWNSRWKKRKKEKETSIHPPRLLLHHLCTLLPRATDKSRQIWGKNTEITTETNFPFTKMEISNVCWQEDHETRILMNFQMEITYIQRG